jgi:hypothetical protein
MCRSEFESELAPGLDEVNGDNGADPEVYGRHKSCDAQFDRRRKAQDAPDMPTAPSPVMRIDDPGAGRRMLSTVPAPV